VKFKFKCADSPEKRVFCKNFLFFEKNEENKLRVCFLNIISFNVKVFNFSILKNKTNN